MPALSPFPQELRERTDQRHQKWNYQDIFLVVYRAGDPVGVSRVFVRVGDTVGRFVDVYIVDGSGAAENGFAVGSSLSKTHNFELYRRWLSECDLNHSGCVSQIFTELPARFLAVTGSDGSDILHLAQRSEMDGHYAALSYCWGASTTGLVASKACIEPLFISINLEDLSKTVSDAVRITRRLGLRYLWVDSLCIVQDDVDDWTRESSKMDKVYQAAYVTIVASSAQSSTEGCLQPRPSITEEVQVDFSISPSRERCKMVFKPHTNSISEDLLNNPWNQRGWCLQEYALSRRILHFFNNRVVWQCKESLLAEDYDQLRLNLTEANKQGGIQPYFGLHQRPDLSLWFDIVEAYSLRKLTVASDKLVAVAGLANYFRDNIDAAYMYGIWLFEIHRGILWVSSGNTHSASVLRAPTWSWASVDGPINHLQNLQDSKRFHTPILQIKHPHRMDTMNATTIFDANGTQHHLEVSAPRQQVLRSDWTLNVGQFNMACSESLKDLLYDKKDMQCHFLFDPEGELCGWASFDEEDFMREDMFCIHISTVRRDDMFEAHNVLVVVGVEPRSEDRFRRVGAGEVVSEGFFRSCPHVESIVG